MSIDLIKRYHSKLERIIDYGGSKKETSIRTAFQNLLDDYASLKGLMLIPEVTLKTPEGKNIMPDGVLKDALRQDWGYWESKDEDDDLDVEIQKKFRKGYPDNNILFEDSKTAILIQNRKEVKRVSMNNAIELHALLTKFIEFERPEVNHFRIAIEKFKDDIPKVTSILHEIIEREEGINEEFIKIRSEFWELCKKGINPDITKEDINEMIIQHILTDDLFNTIFDETQFHRENDIANALQLVVGTFFKGNVRRATLSNIQHYYKAMNAAAASISDHHEKQKFLKAVYETFYKSYNPNAADRLGVVYTPNEIVKFMIESTDSILHKHFNKFLEDKNVHILDPAVGTGTFICDIIDYLRKEKVEYKYKNELHGNEVSILPYYIANLNIEYTYFQKTGKYIDFNNLCFVDTLDNMGFEFRGKQMDLFNPFTLENFERKRKQNSHQISVVIGNPPYNSNQENENDDNKNRSYPAIDQRIKETFKKFSKATKTKAEDPFRRFYRWSMDRLDNKGVVAFITNSSFLDSKSDDGFRYSIEKEFQYAYIIDLGGDIRSLSGRDGIFLNEEHTIFGVAAAVGIAIMFLVKDASAKHDKCQIRYIHPTDIRATRKEKIAYLNETKFNEIAWEIIRPDERNNWINLSESNFKELVPIANKAVKEGKSKKAIFKLFCWGNSSNRDNWVYARDSSLLRNKINYFIDSYNGLLDEKTSDFPDIIKWSRDLKEKFQRNQRITFNDNLIKKAYWRPFSKKVFYAEKILNDVLTSNHYQMFGNDLDKPNVVMMITVHKQVPFIVHVTDRICDAGYGSRATNNIPLFVYDETGQKHYNLTDYGLNKFTRHYKTKKIKKENVFNYIYAVLHNPNYVEKYKLDLRRDLPNIPFYEDFFKWQDWGEELINLHLNYEDQEPFELIEKNLKDFENPKVKLSAKRDKGIIKIDENTQIEGIPESAWKYKLGNRSALDWVLDQNKEKKSRDKIVEEKFNNYKFANKKYEVIDLIKKICTISVRTIEILEEMTIESKS